MKENKILTISSSTSSQQNNFINPSLHIKSSIFFHFYFFPFFFIIYPIILILNLTYSLSKEFNFILLFIIITINTIMFCSCFWSNEFKVYFTCSKTREIEKADFIKFTRKNNSQEFSTELCEIIRKEEKIKEIKEIYFEFQKTKFYYEKEENKFISVEYPVSLPLSEYFRVKGLTTKDSSKNLSLFSKNNHFIPIPTFTELMLQQIIAPFFIFQIFCVLLWIMDEYWYYSLFTLLMLFVFESTVVFQRLGNLKELRGMSGREAELVYCFRDGIWCEVYDDLLVPFDLVCLSSKNKSDLLVCCDLLLLSGSCIVNEAMLSGESTPKQKESLLLDNNDNDVLFDLEEFKVNVLFGGTKIIQTSNNTNSFNNKPLPVENGCIGFVLRTGFGTSQGELVKTMIYNTQRITANTSESFLFILILVIFALISSINVYLKGVEIGRSKSKLLLDCILIISSVVPPELPLELSMAVNQSLVALSRFAVFCVEPFRIPFGGRVDFCCFDKTGTLTNVDLDFQGVKLIGDKDDELVTKVEEFPLTTLLCISTSHSVMLLENNVGNTLIGDPMEKTVLNAMGYTVEKGDLVKSKNKPSPQVKILKRFPFTSTLKRMSAISSIELSNSYLSSIGFKEDKNILANYKNKLFVGVKGAPEVMKDFYSSVPDDYESTYKHLAYTGSRVISLGYKWIPQSKYDKINREEIESDLIFCGFLVFHCPLKDDSVLALRELHESLHRCVIITGDNALTACFVAKEVFIVRRKVLIIDFESREGKDSGLVESGSVVCKSVDEEFSVEIKEDEFSLAFVTEKYQRIFNEFDLCLTGKALSVLQNTPLFKKVLLTKIWVYARTSPAQKEHILICLKEAGFITLMCGDGTNDVGALKQSHVGVALLDGTKEDLEKIAVMMRQRRMEEVRKKQEEMYKAWGVPPPAHIASNNDNATTTTDPRQMRLQKQQKSLNEMMEKLQDQVEEMPMIKFGDASIAAPFTSKLRSVTSICQILRQGRCTLVTTIQMYKILALNCLINAFSLSALYLDGIKHGDAQLTIQGFLLAGCFMFLSWGKPIDRLSRKRPQPNIFNWYIMTSVLGQFIVHIVALWTVVTEAKKYLSEDWKVDLEDTKFAPNILNTAVYLISLSMQVSTFMLNYQGRPFRESLRENKPLWFSLTGLYGLAVLCAGEVFPELNEYMELVKMPGNFSDFLVKAILLDLGASFVVEYVSNYFFSDNKPSKSLGLDDRKWEALMYRSSDIDGEMVVKAPNYK